VNVLVCDLLHDPVAAAVLAVTVGVPHASVAVAVPMRDQYLKLLDCSQALNYFPK
jgi:hypothetical protein